MNTRIMTSVRYAFNTSVWQPSVSEWMKSAQCIQPEEKDRIGKFVFQRDAKSSMIGRLMLRRMLHRVTKIPYSDIKLGRTEKGKPYLLNGVDESCNNLSFNISHHGDYVVLAAELNHNVGIDVMKLQTPVGSQSIPEFFRIMNRQFTPEEWKQIETGSTDADKLCIFYRLWCLKESYVKLLGIGIGFEVKRLNFCLKDDIPLNGDIINSSTLKVDSEPVTDWVFEESLLDNHCVTVALNKTSISPVRSSPVFELLSFNELMDNSSPLSDLDQKYAEQFINKPNSPTGNKKDSSRCSIQTSSLYCDDLI